MKGILQNRKKLARAALKPFWGISLLILFVATIAFSARAGTAPAFPSSLANSVITLEPSTSTAQASPTATSTLSPTPTVTSLPINRMTVTPPAYGQVITLTTPADAIGWVSDLDGRSHFNMPLIHVGTYQGATYYGVIRFDLSAVPPGSSISFAALELVGLDARHLGQGGSWQVNLLDTSLDKKWPDINFAMVAAAAPAASLSLDMNSNRLAPNYANQFIFDAQARAELEQRLSQGNITFRLDGPSAAEDNLFSWNSGYSRQAAASQMIVLSLITIPAATVPDIISLSSNDVIVTSTPTAENIITVAAMAAEATRSAEINGPATAVPTNWVTPIIVTPQATPANPATAVFREQEATAQAFLFGPATATPFNVWTATPSPTALALVTVDAGNDSIFVLAPTPTATATPVYIRLDGDVATPWVPSTLTPTPVPVYIPPELVGKIAFLSNRSGGPEPLTSPLVYLINPDGSDLAVMTGGAIYKAAIARESFSSDQRFRVFVKDALRFDNKQVPALYFYDYYYAVEEQITHFGAGFAWDPVWSPTRKQIAFVSNDSKDDEIWIVNRDGSNITRLTDTNEQYNAREIGKDSFKAELDGHPSWSPDGSQLVFWSNRGGPRQIWVMNADGSNAYTLSTTSHDDWNPVWIKYTDPARDLNAGHR